MSDTASEVSILDREIRDIFGFETLSCAQDKELNEGGMLFPELEGKLAYDEAGILMNKCSILKEPSSKQTKDIRLKLDGATPEDDFMEYLAGAVSDGHVSVGADSTSRGFEDVDYGYDLKLNGNLSMSKNAVAARENRLKKKNYVSNLETSVKELSKKNNSLKKDVGNMETTIASLQTEVDYLKSVLANQGTIGALLQNIASTQGVKFNSSEFKAISKPTGDCMSPRDGLKRRKAPNSLLSSSFNNQKENVQAVNGVTTRIASTCKIQKLDHDYAADSRKHYSPNGYEAESDTTDSETEADKNAGVCLHVSNKKVSLEFCASCSKKASSSSTTRRKTVASRR